MASASGDAKRAARAAEPADFAFNSSRGTRPRNIMGVVGLVGASIIGFLWYTRKAAQAPMDSSLRPGITARYRDIVKEMDAGSATRLHQEQAKAGVVAPSPFAAMDAPGVRTGTSPSQASPEAKAAHYQERIDANPASAFPAGTKDAPKDKNTA